MEALKMIPIVVLSLVVAGVVAGVGAITMGEFSSTTTDVNALLAIGNATEGISTVAQQQPTLAIIAVMVIIIMMLAGVFTVFRYYG